MLSHKIQIINIRENFKISEVNKNLPEIVLLTGTFWLLNISKISLPKAFNGKHNLLKTEV